MRPDKFLLGLLYVLTASFYKIYLLINLNIPKETKLPHKKQYIAKYLKNILADSY